MSYTPRRVDIIHLEFDPATGREMKDSHFAFVLGGHLFNQHGLAVICPILQGAARFARTYGAVVSWMGLGPDTPGAIHCHQVSSLDWQLRRARFRESTPQALIDEVSGRVGAILFD